MKIQSVDIASLIPDLLQPRKTIRTKDIVALALSLKEHGQIEPVLVYKKDGKYFLIDGHRRLLAAIELGLSTLEAVVLDEPPTEAELLVCQLAIQCHRKDLSVFDKYLAFERLKDKEQLNNAKLAIRLAISKPSVTRALSIGNLIPELQDLVREGKIGSAKAYALARKTEAEQKKIYEKLRIPLSGEGETSTDSTETKKVKRVTFPLPDCVITYASEHMDLDQVILDLRKMMTAIRKAQREGYDAKTLAQVLRSTQNQVKEDAKTTVISSSQNDQSQYSIVNGKGIC